MSFLRSLRKFILNQSSNFRVLLVQGIVTNFLTQLVQDFNNLYIIALGATPFQLSTVRAIGSGVNAIISTPAGWLSDLYSIKKVLIAGLLVQIVSVAFYAFAENWLWIILAILSSTITSTLVFRSQNIFIGDSLTEYDRATGYGLRMMLIQFFSVFAPTIGGILVFYFGGISVDGIRPLYFIQLIGFMVISTYVFLKLVDIKTRAHGRGRVRGFLGDYGKLLKTGKGLKRFAFVHTVDIANGMSIPFFFVYAAEFKGADSLIIGLMGTCYVLVSMFLAIPMGALADRRGRKLVIFLVRPFFYGSYLLLVLAPPGAYWLLLFAWCLRGGLVGMSSSWQAMMIEIVPKEYRGRWVGFISLSQNLVSVLAMLFAGYLYENVNPALVFLLPIAVDGFIRMPILATIPDTVQRKD